MRSYMGFGSQSKPTTTYKPQISHKAAIEEIINNYKQQMQISSIFNQHQAINHILSILFHPYHPQETQTIQAISQLSTKWMKSLTELYLTQTQLFTEPELKCYESWILSARLLKAVGAFFSKLVLRRCSEWDQKYKLDDVGNYLSKNSLRFVYARHLFQKKNYGAQTYYSTHSQESQHTNNLNWAQLLYEYCKEVKCEMVVRLLQLLAALDIIRLEGDNNKAKIKNTLMDSLHKITRPQQKEMFIDNYRFQHLKDIQQNKQKEDVLRILTQTLPNYTFYKNSRTIRRNMKLEELHNKFQDYEFLQRTHDYIQWMFPNHYGSNFNSDSFPLNYIESQLFLQDKQIQAKLLHSIVLFFDFMGLRFNKENKLVIQQKARLKDVILKCHHNHLRIMRILACLSVTGFRDIALELIQFLDKHTQASAILAKERREFEKNWQIYGDKCLPKAKQMCFLETTQFPPSHGFWKEITAQMPFYKKKKSWTSTYQQQSESESQQGDIVQQPAKHIASKQISTATISQTHEVVQAANKIEEEQNKVSLSQQKIVSEQQQQNQKPTDKHTELVEKPLLQQTQVKAEPVIVVQSTAHKQAEDSVI